MNVIDEKIHKEILLEAKEIGIPREKILPLRIFQIPFFNFEEYVKIKNSHISIISDCCAAGYLYHKFGLEFTSPTINMFADNGNYIRFISDLKKYMKEPMVELSNIMDNPYEGRFFYPRGMVGDVVFQFNHDSNFDTAAERWRKGVERFNWDNYIVIMVILSEEVAYKFDSLPIEHKIGFYWKELGLNSVVCIPEWQDAEIRAKYNYNFSNIVNRVATEVEGFRAINWMKALQHKNDIRRIKGKE